MVRSRASTGDTRFRAPFLHAANEAFDAGGCFCLASLMQGLERGGGPDPAATASAASVPVSIAWGDRDRTRKHSGAMVERFEDCGHSPELEAPARFAEWLLAWHANKVHS